MLHFTKKCNLIDNTTLNFEIPGTNSKQRPAQTTLAAR